MSYCFLVCLQRNISELGHRVDLASPQHVRLRRKLGNSDKESRRLWFRDLLKQLDVTDPEALATQLALPVDGSIAQDLVRDDPAMARAAKQAARVLLKNAGVKVGGEDAPTHTSSSPRKRGPIRRGGAV